MRHENFLYNHKIEMSPIPLQEWGHIFKLINRLKIRLVQLHSFEQRNYKAR